MLKKIGHVIVVSENYVWIPELICNLHCTIIFVAFCPCRSIEVASVPIYSTIYFIVKAYYELSISYKVPGVLRAPKWILFLRSLFKGLQISLLSLFLKCVHESELIYAQLSPYLLLYVPVSFQEKEIEYISK